MAEKEKNFVSAVVYIHNAEEQIERFLKMLIDVLERNFEHSEIICVNDESRDESVDRIREISKIADTASISVLNMSYFHGLEQAMSAGVDLSIGDFVYEFDSTILDYDPSEIMRVYYRALEGYDIVSASADRKQRLSSTVFYRLFNAFADLSYSMYTENFRVLSRRVINRISGMNKTIPYRKAIYANCGLKTDRLIYPVINEKQKSKTERREKRYRMGLAVNAMILFTEGGYRFSLSMTALMILITVFMAVYSLVMYVSSDPIEGWTTTILFLAFSFFGLFGILTIVIKYLQILVELVFKRVKYSFESIEKMTK